MEPIRIEHPHGDGWPNPGEYGWASGAGLPAPGCHGCGAPVPWRDLRWEPVLDSAGRIVVGPGDAWHPGCRVRAGWSALAAASRDLVEAGGLVGRAFGGLVPPVVDAGRTILQGGGPLVAERGWAAVAAAREVLEGGRLVARRRVRGLRLDRVGRPVGTGVGILVDRAARVGWRLDLVRARGLEAWTEWRRGVGYSRAWRLALDGRDEVAPPVVAVGEFDRWGFRLDEHGFRPIGLRWALDGVDPSAGEAAAAAGGGGDEVVRAFAARFRGIGPAGHGDVDTPSQQRRRRGRGRQRPGQE